MSWAAVRRLVRRALLLPTGKRHRPRPRRRKFAELIDLEGPEAKAEEQWIRDLLPPAEAWAPRITRWIRVTFPMPDDTILLPPGTAAMVLELLASDFTWDPPCAHS